MYPESWKLSEYGEAEEFHEISLESPDGSIWSVSIFRDEMPAEELIQSCLAALQEQYSDLESTPFSGDFHGYAASGFDADFYCLDFLVTAQGRTLNFNGKTFSFFCQAESREFEKLKDVFAAITTSLINQP